jgi:hypothetical protein
VRSVPGIGQTALFGAPRARFHPGHRPTSSEDGWVPPGYGRRSSSERRALRLTEDDNQHPSGYWAPFSTGTGNLELFGASGPPSRRNKASEALRSLARPVPPGTGNPRLFGGSAPVSTRPESYAQGVGPPGLPGSPCRALRSPAQRASPGQGSWSSSERHQPGSAGQGTRGSSESRAPQPNGVRQPELFGAPRAEPHGVRQPELFGAPRAEPHGVRQTALFGGPRAEPHRDQGSGALRSIASRFHPGQGSPASTGLGNRSSSERRSLVPSGWVPAPRGWAPVLLGAPRPASRNPATGTLRSAERQVPPRVPRSSERGALGARQTALFGGPRAEPHRDQGSGALRSIASRFHRDRVTAPLRRNGNQVSTGAGSPGLTGVRQTALFGGPRAEPHRDMAIGALRSPERRIPSRHGSLISSRNRSLAPLGAREGR